MESKQLEYSFKFTEGYSISKKASVMKKEWLEELKAKYPTDKVEKEIAEKNLAAYKVELDKFKIQFILKNLEALPKEKIKDAIVKSIIIDIQSVWRDKNPEEIKKLAQETQTIDLKEFYAAKLSKGKTAGEKALTAVDKVEEVSEIDELIKALEAKKAALKK